MSEPFDDRDGEDDLAALRALGARHPRGDETWETPPSDLWDRIAAGAGVAGSPVAGTAGEAGAPASETVVVPFERPARKVPRWVVPVLSAAAVLIIAVVFVAIANRPGEPEVLASTTLDLLGDSGSGQAELVDDGGTLQLRLETADLDAGDGFLEVWVIDPTVSKLISLGPLRPDGVYDLPEGIDPAEFPIVDVSIEPVDGDPTHSGNSVLRGQLPV